MADIDTVLAVSRDAVDEMIRADDALTCLPVALGCYCACGTRPALSVEAWKQSQQ